MTTRREFLRALGIMGALAATGAGTISLSACNNGNSQDQRPVEGPEPEPKDDPWSDGNTQIMMSTFLGNEFRRFYGKGDVSKLRVKSKFRLGCSESVVGKKRKSFCGAGWTGQPSVYLEGGKVMLVLGGMISIFASLKLRALKRFGNTRTTTL